MIFGLRFVNLKVEPQGDEDGRGTRYKMERSHGEIKTILGGGEVTPSWHEDSRTEAKELPKIRNTRPPSLFRKIVCPFFFPTQTRHKICKSGSTGDQAPSIKGIEKFRLT
jgi:hypothetical protein